MDNEKKEQILEEEEEEETCKPLTDEEFEEWKKNEARKEKKARGIANVIYEIFHFFT